MTVPATNDEAILFEYTTNNVEELKITGEVCSIGVFVHNKIFEDSTIQGIRVGYCDPTKERVTFIWNDGGTFLEQTWHYTQIPPDEYICGVIEELAYIKPGPLDIVRIGFVTCKFTKSLKFY